MISKCTLCNRVIQNAEYNEVKIIVTLGNLTFTRIICIQCYEAALGTLKGLMTKINDV